jgi:hypothetical protein
MCSKRVKGLYQSRLELNRVFGGRSMLWHVYNRGDSRLEIDLWSQKNNNNQTNCKQSRERIEVLPMASEYTLAASLD